MPASLKPLEIDLSLYTRKRLVVTMRVPKIGVSTPQIVLEAEDGLGIAVALFGPDSPAARADAARMMDLWNSALDANLQLTMVEALRMTLVWIDSVPQETDLPAMPGFDRDWVNTLLEPATDASPASSIEEALGLAIEWVRAVPQSIRAQLKPIDLANIEGALAARSA